MKEPVGLYRTPLFKTNMALGAKMTPFAGWEMPIQYSSILNEARKVRSEAGLFDVSHMGRLKIQGPEASHFLNNILSFDVPQLQLNRAKYSVICNESGGIIDDCITYRIGQDRFLLIPNASNTTEVLRWLKKWSTDNEHMSIEDITVKTAMIACQGPKASDVLSKTSGLNLDSIGRFCIVKTQIAGNDSLIARTGYTGEDGFELILQETDAVQTWGLLLNNGAKPCGLGARDILRLEAGLLLHGNDMDTSTNPYEAGLNKFIDPDRDEYIAGPTLRQIRDSSLKQLLVGFVMMGRGIARHGYPIMDDSRQIGVVTSGSYSPTLDSNIGLGYVPICNSIVGSRFRIDIRGRHVEAKVASLPFYSRKKGT